MGRYLISLLLISPLFCVSGCLKISRPENPSGQIAFSAEDDRLLEKISYASFQFFWKEAHPQSGLVRDKTGVEVCSVASLGFGLAALPIGAERGFVSREEACERALKILRTLRASNAHHEGVYCHFIDLANGHTTSEGYESGASTIDTALLVAGAIVAGEYFGGQVNQLAEELFARVNWRAFVNPANGQVYMTWVPEPDKPMSRAGHFESQTWDWYSDETLLIVLLGQSAPNREYRLAPKTLTNWIRRKGSYKGKEFIISWPGTLFTYMFAHCFYDFKRMGPDPQGVDWFENTRQAAKANRDWCRDHSAEFKTYHKYRWGITAGSGPNHRYVVPGHQPRGADGDKPEGGTLHPYGAAMALPFLPEDSIMALRHMYSLEVAGKPIWKSPEQGGYGFWDGFNLDQNWVSDEVIGIAQGPMLLMIENARSGFVWKLFTQNRYIQAGIENAGFGCFKRHNDITIDSDKAHSSATGIKGLKVVADLTNPF